MCYIIDISTIYRKINKSKFIATVASVVLVLIASLSNTFLLRQHYSGTSGFGGPVVAGAATEGELAYSFIAVDGLINSFEAAANNDKGNSSLVNGFAFISASSPLTDVLPSRDGLMVYKVQPGDSLSKIAANFGISLNTILWANSSIRANLIRPGQEIIILPMSGVVHSVQEGETLALIANVYGISIQKIVESNPQVSQGGLVEGQNLIIPGVRPKNSLSQALISNLPDLSDYFIIPTSGLNWGRLHAQNAVDIANVCGTPIYAAAEGLVISEQSYGWNSGYGHFIDIQHPNGVITRYSHTQRNVVSVGDYVLQGDLIGYIGNTGNTHGPTGCHLHFEVRGAKNPFVR